MNTRKLSRLLFLVPVIAMVLLFVWCVHGRTAALMDPKGIIAEKERNLILFTAFLSLFVVIPVFTLAIVISWKYRATNTEATYTPEWGHSTLLETIWWGIPCAIILVLSVVTWQSSHSLDPFKAIASNTKPLNVQVVAMDWKWLFIYPDQHIASVNLLEIPAHTPVNFTITSDAPMNSFWIPQLGGQIYAMQGMTTQLHLVADEVGSYRGLSANLSGDGFSGMDFTAKAVNNADFAHWISGVQQSPQQLTSATYAKLAQPSKNNKVAAYVANDNDLYDSIIMKYMMPMPQAVTAGATSTAKSTANTMPGMDM